MVTEATSYDKQTGYYTIQPEPQIIVYEGVEVHQAVNDSNNNLIDIPWDNDTFTLCLESFPSTESSIKKYNRVPATASPLRMQWVSPNDSSSTEDTSQANESVSTTTNGSRPRRKKRLNIVPSIDNSFPYINDDTFLDRIQPPPKQKSDKQQERLGRVEYISPLMNSSIIFNEQDILFKSRATKSVSSHTNQSQVSNRSVAESWKVAQSPAGGMISPIVLPPNRIISREHNSVSGSSSPRSYTSSHSPQPLTYSASIRSIGPKSISANGVYYTPPASVTSAKTSYRGVHVPNNADGLFFYSDSIYSSTPPPSEKDRPYSQLFNPSYQQSRGKKPAGLFTKLMKNFKSHFAK